MTSIYYLYLWSDAKLDIISTFFFADVTKKQLVDLLRERIKGLEVFDPHEECVPK